jgi:hypothetical protein
LAQGNLDLYNTLFALTQVLIGLGLLYRRTVKPALAVSFAWAVVVWWFGEAFGMLFMNMANPLTGAPGAVLLYAIIGLIVWPNDRPGGLLGVRVARTTWVALWLAMSWLWLLGANSSANATHDLINAAPSGMSWLSTVQNAAASLAKGNGLVIAIVLALLSATIGVAVGLNRWARPFLAIAIVLNLAYWVLGQGFGGIFAGNATDPNAGPLFVLLAVSLYGLVPVDHRVPATARSATGSRRVSSVAATMVVAGAAAALLAGCASANKTTSTTASAAAGGSTSMAGMSMSASSVKSVNGIKPVPTQALASTTWQGMRIQARAMTAVPFVVFNGTSERTIKPPAKTSFHLMVMLNDAHTGVALPYAGVWATISKAGKVVYDERQWPMLSAYMGPHYGNNVSLPGAGEYQLTLLISPPVSARHVEYENVWLHPHRVNVSFHWTPVS